MEQHPIPRQITTFEFKLIGFMTVKQFGFVLLGGVVGYLLFMIIQIPVINIIVGLLVFCVGLAFGFVPINDRPLDVFLRNLIKRIGSPTQYTYHKDNPTLSIFNSLYFENNPHIVMAHVESREKLAAYIASKKQPTTETPIPSHQKQVVALLNQDQNLSQTDIPSVLFTDPAKSAPENNLVTTPLLNSEGVVTKHPFFTGTVYNNRHIPLPGILLYIKDSQTNSVLRILKTNPYGVFATFNPLQDGEYIVDIVDSANNYNFDQVKITLSNQSKNHMIVSSKETV